MKQQDKISSAERFAENLRHLMQEKNINQARLATLSDVAQSGISKYVNGTALPRVGEFVRMAEALDVSLDTLWYGLSEKESVSNNKAEKELGELKHSLRVVFRAMSEPENK